MTVEPSYSSFETTYNEGKPQVLYTELVADLETPVSAYLKLAAGRPYSFLFDSVEGGAEMAELDMLTGIESFLGPNGQYLALDRIVNLLDGGG